MKSIIFFALTFLSLLCISCTFTYDITTQAHPESLPIAKKAQNNASSLSESLFWLVNNNQFEENFDKQYDRVYNSIMSGDLSRFYYNLFPTPQHPNEREIRFYGIPNVGAYTFYLGNHPPQKIGESQFKINLQKRGEQRYILNTSLEFFLKDQGPYTIPKVLDNFFANLIQPAKGKIFQKGLQSTHDAEMLWKVKNSYPFLYPLLKNYTTMYSLASPTKDIPQKIDLCGTVNWIRLTRKYPHMAQWLKKFRRVINSHIYLKNKEERTLAYFNINSREFYLRSVFAVDSDGLVPMKSPEEIGFDYGQKLQDIQDFEFIAEFGIDAQVLGLVIEIEDLKAKINLNLNSNDGKLTYNFLPDCTVRVKGNLLYFLPKSMIDVLIPSNIEELIRSFIEEMIREQGARGGLMVSKVDNGYIWKVYSRQHLLNNGFLKVAANFIRIKFNLSEEQKEELGEMFLKIVCAFEEISYQKMKKTYPLRFKNNLTPSK